MYAVYDCCVYVCYVSMCVMYVVCVMSVGSGCRSCLDVAHECMYDMSVRMVSMNGMYVCKV